MAYLSPFEYDIFISYARYNDEPKPGTDFRWVEYFERRLNYAFTQVFGEEGLIRVWRDRGEIGGSTDFNDAIRDGIERSALFIALLSNAYMKRDYCRKELESFYRKAERETFGLKLGSRSRLFNVRLQNVPADEWPEELADRTGFKFHDDKPLSEMLQPGPEFDAQFSELLNELVQTLRAFKPLLEQRQRAVEESRKSHTVFLAHTEGSTCDLSLRLANDEDLKREGVRIITNVPPPFDYEQHRSRVKTEIENADLVVNILDEWRGRPIADAPDQDINDPKVFYSWEQVSLGLQHAKSQLIYVPDTVKIPSIENPNHQSLLYLLEKRDFASLSKIGIGAPPDAPPRRARYSFVQEPKDALKRIIIEQLKEAISLGPEPGCENTDGSPPVALLDLHKKDSRFAQDLNSVLIERGVEVRMMPDGDTPESNNTRFKDSLKQASIFLVICGQVAPDWVNGRLNRALQIMVMEKCSINLWGVYVPPIEGLLPTARTFSLPKPPQGSLKPYRIDSPEKLRLILEAME